MGKDAITGLRNLWVVAAALIAWSAVMVAAERVGRRARALDSVGTVGGLAVWLLQCVALIPGVSRSGAGISAGLFLGLDRFGATCLSFFLSIPAMSAPGGRRPAVM